MPIQRRIPVLISDNEIEVLYDCCSKILTYLSDEQIRITNFLPEGRY
ncbi:MAG: hypothetical protein GY932_12090 [Arcobacter sp.]|nr:hypothetical protein [Arcobacter sp.]